MVTPFVPFVPSKRLIKNREKIYVDTAASVNGSGGINSPFNSVENAEAYIAEKKAKNKYAKDGYTVYLRGGVYKPLVLTQSGYPDAEICYKAYENETVTVSAGTEISFSEFVTSDNETVPDSSKGEVYVCNLTQKGIPGYNSLQVTGHGLYYLSLMGIIGGGMPAPFIMYDNKEGNLARYPNNGYTQIKTVVEQGDVIEYWLEESKNKPEYVPESERNYPPVPMTFEVYEGRIRRWTTAKNPWVHGYWFYDWSDLAMPVRYIDGTKKTIQTEYPSVQGVRAGQRFYIYNLLEELDSPLEWYYDKETGDLYVYPENPDTTKKIIVVFSDTNLLKLNKISNVEIEDINFAGTRGNGAEIEWCENILVNDCNFSNISGTGVNVEYGENVEIVNCEVSSIGGAGISLYGGNTHTLTPSNHMIVNCDIHDFGKTVKTYTPGIRLMGVGQTAKNNVIYNGPHAAIIFGENDHLIENNEIFNVMEEAADMGAIYCGGNMVGRGTVVRGNYIHDLYSDSTQAGKYAIYLDSCYCGTTVVDNRIENIDGDGMLINAGRNNTIIDNTFKNLNIGIIIYPCGRAIDWYGGVLPPLSRYGLEGDNIVPFQGEAYSKYSNMNDILSDDPHSPKYNVVKGNVGNNVSAELYIDVSVGGSTLTEEEFYSWNTIEQ